MKYHFYVELSGVLEIEADSQEEAQEIVDEGYNITEIEIEVINETFLGGGTK